MGRHRNVKSPEVLGLGTFTPIVPPFDNQNNKSPEILELLYFWWWGLRGVPGFAAKVAPVPARGRGGGRAGGGLPYK